MKPQNAVTRFKKKTSDLSLNALAVCASQKATPIKCVSAENPATGAATNTTKGTTAYSEHDSSYSHIVVARLQSQKLK